MLTGGSSTLTVIRVVRPSKQGGCSVTEIPVRLPESDRSGWPWVMEWRFQSDPDRAKWMIALRWSGVLGCGFKL